MTRYRRILAAALQRLLVVACTAFISIFLLTVLSSVALASNFKTVCRPPVPSQGPPRTLLPLSGELCNNGIMGNNCPGGVQATDEIEVINILPGDTINFTFTLDETPATFTNTVQIGNGNFTESGTQFFSSIVSGQVNYVVVNPDQDINNGLKFQLQIPNTVQNRQFVSYTVSCTQAPQQDGFINIKKALDPTSDPGAPSTQFTFKLDGGEGIPLSISSVVATDETGPLPVTPNVSHTVQEFGPPANWTLTDIDCGDNQNPATVSAAPGQIVTCKFTNKFEVPKGTIKVKKSTVGGNRKFDFDISQPASPSSFQLMNGGEKIFSSLPVGDYTIGEILPQGWTLQDIDCGGQGTPNGNSITVALDENETITCTFTDFKEHDDPMMEETKRFIKRRVDNLLTHGPDRARMLRRLKEQAPPSLKDSPIKFSGNQSGNSLSRASASSTNNGGMMSLGGALALNNDNMVAEDGVPWVSDAFTSSAREETFGISKGPTSTSSSLLSSIASQLTPLAAGQSSFKFGTSLSEMRRKAAESEARAQQKKLKDAGLSFDAQPYTNPFVALRPGFDIWVEGQISRYNDDIGGINREGDFRILYVGADYILAPGILIGALVQIDDTNEDINGSTRTGEIDGTGWMVGPYFGARLLDNLFFDARAVWGQSNNDIWIQEGKIDTYRTGSFETERWLATATLTGVHTYGGWRLSPELGLAYGHESFSTYTNSLNQTEKGESARIGRLTGGAELAYPIQMRNGTTIEPMVGITGIWNFDSTSLTIDGVVQQTDESRAKVEGGLQISTPSGWGLRAAGNYDGLGGGDFQSYGGSLWVNVPLN